MQNLGDILEEIKHVGLISDQNWSFSRMLKILIQSYRESKVYGLHYSAVQVAYWIMIILHEVMKAIFLFEMLLPMYLAQYHSMVIKPLQISMK